MPLQSSRPQLTLPVGERDHILGNPDASVTLVEYGDYECPHCGRAHSILKELRAQESRFRLVYRHFPLTAIHPHAEPAAEAAEAAGAQGQFWEMHDLLFEHQDALDMIHLVGYARALGLDLNRFTSEMSARTHAAKVREDFLSGARSGVNGTPTFFINGVRHNGSYELPSLMAAVEDAAGAGRPVRRAR
jgi:protein-disulfide isomerase